MDKSVLTEQRREMVINLLKGMKIRKSDGEGFDKDDVYACMQQLCDVYEKSIDDLTINYETEISEMQDKYQKYDENNDLYISLIMEAKKSSNEIINKAKSEVDEILAQGKEQIAAQEDEITKFRETIDTEKASLQDELEATRAAIEQEKVDLVKEIEAERVKSEAAKEQYRSQIAVMDQEFDEIKTNILRTSGKIDGLKAQLEELQSSAHWEVEAEQAPVDVPQPDIAIEETIEPAAAEAPEELTFEELVKKMQADDLAKAGQAVEVETAPPAEPAIEVPAFEEPAPVFDAPAEPAVEVETAPPAEPAFEIPAFEAEPAPAFDVPAEPVAEIPVEPAFGEPAPEIPVQPIEEAVSEIPPAPAFEEPAPAFEEPPAFGEPAPAFEEPAPAEEFSLDALLEEVKGDASVDSVPLDSVLDEAKAGVEAAPVEELAPIEEMALEELSIDLPEEAPAAEEPVEEISFEGLEELFKE